MDFYVILGLQHGAKESDIKRAYRRLARRFHPDINPGDREAEARFREILKAYETLIDPDRRSRYEAGHGSETPGERQTSGFEGFDFSTRGSDHALTFGDLFADVLSERTARPVAQERGADLHQEVHVTFEEAFLGGSRLLALTRRETCATCAGSGVLRAGAAPCIVCQGAGRVRSVRGHMVFSKLCGSCQGSGQQRPRACQRCGDSGRRSAPKRSRWASRRVSATAIGFAWKDAATRDGTAGCQATCTFACTSRRTRCSAASVTTST